MVLAFPSLEYLPILGPKTMAAAKAENPPMAWTAAEPAKSLKPLMANHPLGFHTQLATNGYITPQKITTKIAYDHNFILSAKAPETIDMAAIANPS